MAPLSQTPLPLLKDGFKAPVGYQDKRSITKKRLFTNLHSVIFKSISLFYQNTDYQQANETAAVQRLLKKLTKHVAEKVKTARAYVEQEKMFVSPKSFCQGNFIAVDVSLGRLGNLMFQTASLLGISRKIQRQPFFLKKDPRFDSFEGFWIPTPPSEGGNCSWKRESFKVMPDDGAGTHTSRLEHQNLTKEVKPILLTGFLQSWRYFDDIRGSIKLLFTFKQSIYDNAIRIIGQQLQTFFLLKGPGFSEDPVLVGIHVRRGDYVAGPLGLVPAPESYLLRQLDEFRKKFQTAIFLITSDDLGYCRRLFKGDDVFVLEENTAELDMAVLSLTDHVVVSVGSYGWWIAYLSDAKSVTYYESWLNGSVLKQQFPKGDYFLSHWTGSNK
jgi:galactoside 2-L-fucosyltransferase 1/2